MHISVESVPISRKHVIANLLELYAHDFSEISPNPDKFEVDENGLFGYPFLDKFWQEKNSFVYLIKVNNNIAGFALIRQHSLLQSQEPVFKIAEFFVMRKYRKKGIGMTAAHYIFQRHPGHWEIPVLKENTPGLKFWLAVVENITKGNYQKADINNAQWKGLVLAFLVH